MYERRRNEEMGSVEEDIQKQTEGTRERKCESDISFTNVSSEITFIMNNILVEIYTSKNLALVLRKETKLKGGRKRRQTTLMVL